VSRRWLLGLALGAGVSSVAYRVRSLTADGAAAATLVGAVLFARGGPSATAALLTFFVTSSALSRFRARAKQGAQVKGGRRDAWQVLANGGWATLWACLGGERGLGGCVGGLAAAAADTWGTEVGMLAKDPPRLITTLAVVPPGTSGGVTLEGLAAGVAGAWLVGVASLVGSRRRSSSGPVAAIAAGVVGSLLDSLLGATVQAAYWCDGCGLATEQPTHARCGQATRRVRGLPGIDNDVVNGLATLAGSLVGARLWRQVRSPHV
jgi:uncharacterized protein (TIGR00297 family)